MEEAGGSGGLLPSEQVLVVLCDLGESLPAECLALFLVAEEMETAAETEGLAADDEEFGRVVAAVLVRSEGGCLFDDGRFLASIVSYFTSLGSDFSVEVVLVLPSHMGGERNL